MSERNQGYVRLVPTKNNQFRVVTVAENGESLTNSETFTSKLNALKNIKAQLNLFGGVLVEVRVFKERPQQGGKYEKVILYADGTMDNEGEETMMLPRRYRKHGKYHNGE